MSSQAFAQLVSGFHVQKLENRSLTPWYFVRMVLMSYLTTHVSIILVAQSEQRANLPKARVFEGKYRSHRIRVSVLTTNTIQDGRSVQKQMGQLIKVSFLHIINRIGT